MYSFNEIIGNQNIINSMRSSITNRKVSHAYIIDGRQGMGKKLIANTFAKALLCEAGKPDACCGCVSCRTFDSSNNTDVIYVRPEKTKSIGVSDIREKVNGQAEIKPYNSDYKIFIIENAEEMTEQAQNALLKTLEEPPAYAVFILITSNFSSFLPTILSRCIVFKLKPLKFELVNGYIAKNFDISAEAAHFCAVYGQGSIGAAKKIASSETFFDTRQKIVGVFSNVQGGDYFRLFRMAKELEEFKADIQETLDIAYMWFRDLAIYKQSGDTTNLLQRDLTELIVDSAQNKELDDILNNLEMIWQTKRQLKQNANFQLAIDVLFLRLA